MAAELLNLLYSLLPRKSVMLSLPPMNAGGMSMEFLETLLSDTPFFFLMGGFVLIATGVIVVIGKRKASNILEQHIVFYVLSIFISLVLLVFSFLVVIFLKPGYGLSIYREPFFIVPLSSSLLTYAMGVYFAGSDSKRKKDIFIAVYLFIAGTYLLMMVFNSLRIEPFLLRKLEQVSYFFFSFFPSIAIRLSFLLLGVRIKKVPLLLLESVEFIIAVLSFSPYYFEGYYDFLTFRISAAGHGLTVFVAIQVISLIIIAATWIYRIRRISKRNFAAVAMILISQFLFLFNVLPYLGYPVYLWGDLQILPISVLFFSLKRRNRNHAASVTGRLALLSLLFLPLILMTYALAMFETAPAFQVYMHMILMSSPILISFYIFAFLLSRPFAQKIDSVNLHLRNAHRMEVNLRKIADTEKDKSESLLKNILPASIIDELKNGGSSQPVFFESATVLFADIVGFTRLSEQMTPEELVSELNVIFDKFDRIALKYGIEKIKTMGDSYIAAAGIPLPHQNHAMNMVRAAMEMRDYIRDREDPLFNSVKSIRIGIHTGPLVAGIIGDYKFSYDIWGDTVNTAKRMEENGIPNEINISMETNRMIRPFFICEYRGRISAKNKDDLDMFLIKGEKVSNFEKNENKIRLQI